MDNVEEKQEVLNRLDAQTQRLEEMEKAIISLKNDMATISDMLKSCGPVLKDSGLPEGKETQKSGEGMSIESLNVRFKNNLGMLENNFNESIKALKGNIYQHFLKQDNKIDEILSKVTFIFIVYLLTILVFITGFVMYLLSLIS